MSERRKIVIPKKYIDKYGDENIKMWSFSKISSFSDGCSWEYYLSRILKKKGINNSYAILGGICHDILESFYNGEIKYGGINNIDELNNNLNENCIPREVFNMNIDNYNEFLELRRRLMAKKLRNIIISCNK